MPVQDCHQIGLYFRMPGQFAQCILHYRNTLTNSVDPGADSDALRVLWEGANGALLMAAIPDSVTLFGIKVKRVNNGGGPNIQRPLAIAGGRVGEMSTTGIAPCLVYPYSNGTRWFAGRTFLPGVSEDDIAVNEFTAGLIGDLDAYKDASLLPLVGVLTWSPVVWSPTHATWYPENTVSISGKPGVQNRRMKPSF